MNKININCPMYILAVLSIVAIFGINCNEPNDDTRREFHWTGDINDKGALVHYIVNCDNECVACTATAVESQSTYYLYKSTDLYHDIIQRCLDLEKGTSGNPNTFSVEFRAAPGILNKYGFDYWKDLQDDPTTVRTSYISIEAGESTKFYVILRLKKDAFDDYQIRISYDDTYDLSFTPAPRTTVQDIDSGLNLITLYSLDPSSEGEAKLTVRGRSGDEEFCLAGDCETRDDNLEVYIYKPKKHQVHLYRINNPSFNPTPQQYRDSLNKVLKQAVVFADTVVKNDFTDMVWDDNGNGIMDLFVDKNDVPAERLEDLRLLTSIESTYADVPTCYTGSPPDEQEPKIMILPGTIRRNWLVMEDVSSSDSVIKLNSVIDLKENDEIYISTWGGTPEWDKIDGVDTDSNTITLQIGLSNSYPKHSVVSDPRALVKGFTIASCSWLEDLDNYRNGIHEFCHMKAVGPLSHTLEDSSNLMFPKYGNYGTNLRYRDLKTDDKFGLGIWENQWQQLHTIYIE